LVHDRFLASDDARALRAAYATAARALPPIVDDAAQVLVHGDLHDGNVRLAPDGGVGFLDFDLAHVGDPAADVGNLAAHVVLRAHEDLAPASAVDSTARRRAAERGFARALAFVDAYREHGGPAPVSAVAAAAAHAAFRLACLYRFRLAGRAFADALLEVALRFPEVLRS
ncbi:MAG TPA: phosphotransferase, partial [Planctomycetota bacterium]|nr:phosphotransferase [Planctomycetota bacterium]